MLGLLVGGLLPVQADLGVALPMGDPGHAQVHTHFAALTVEVGHELLEDILLVFLADVGVVLHGLGVDAVLMLGGQLGVGSQLLELGAVHLAHGALEALGDGFAFVNVAANGANKLLHTDYLQKIIKYWELFLNFFEHVGADAAQRALVILGQELALVDEAADGANKLLHTVTSCNKFCLQLPHKPWKLRMAWFTWAPVSRATWEASSTGT